MAQGGFSLHPNFRSIAHPIENMDELVSCFDVDDFVECRSGYDLFSKRDFLKKIGRMKVEKWNPIDALNFKIDYRKIDRFYIHDHGFGDEAELLTYFRMDHDGRPVYIQLKLRVEDSRGGLFFTFDPEIFLRVAIQWQDATMKVWNSLQEDGNIIKAPQKYEYRSRFDWDDVPPLKHLCILEVSHGFRRGVSHFKSYQRILSADLASDVKKHLHLWKVEFDYFE